MVNPSASNEYMAPRLTPLITCCSRTSQSIRRLSKQRERYPRLRLWCRPEILLLVDDIVVRILGIVLVLEDADGAILDVTVVVEGDDALQGLQVGRLHRIANIGAVDLLAALGDALD